MQVFQFNESGLKAIRKRVLKWSIPTMVIAATFGIIIASVNSSAKGDDVNVLPVVIPMVALFVGFGIYRGIKRQKSLLESYKLTMGNNMITREQLNTPTISIYFDDIIQIIKRQNNCIIIKGKEKEDVIMIPTEIDRFPELEEALQNIKPIESKQKNSFIEKYQSFAGILAGILLLCVFTLDDKIIVGATGAISIIILLWSFLRIRRSKNVDNKTKRSLWWVIFVLASVIGTMIFKLGGFKLY